MSKRIKNYELISSLYELLKTEDLFSSETPTLVDSVQPVVDLHAFEAISSISYQIIASATDGDNDHEVPAGERWKLAHVWAYRQNAGDIDIYVFDGSHNQKMQATTAGGTEAFYEPSNEIYLTEGMLVRVSHDTGTAGYLASNVLYTKESV